MSTQKKDLHYSERTVVPEPGPVLLCRSWQVSVLTGQVAGTNTYSTTSTQPTYGTVQTDNGAKQVVTGIRTSTSVHTTLLLVDKAGQQHSCTLTNFGLEVFDGQIVSVCSAARGRKNVVFAVRPEPGRSTGARAQPGERAVSRQRMLTASRSPAAGPAGAGC
jgi:hypothetical protein